MYMADSTHLQTDSGFCLNIEKYANEDYQILRNIHGEVTRNETTCHE